MINQQHQDWLLELVSLPTAPGREDRVGAWVERWAEARPGVNLTRDPYGNIQLSRKGVAQTSRPIFFQAHMDHPAFLVTAVADRQVEARFIGGVQERFFQDASVLLFHDDHPPQPGVVQRIAQSDDSLRTIRAQIGFENPVRAAAGDILNWDTGPVRIDNDYLYAAICDDLAGVAAVLSALDVILQERAQKALDVRILLTRAEEAGLIGAIAASKTRQVPVNARLICVENSRSFAESPVGGGPVVRVGDRTTTFDPDLTYVVSHVADQVAQREEGFRWQRRLMPGGTCEASVFCAYGYTATGMCLPLGRYHNMNLDTGRIDAEVISLSDYHGLIRLLVAVGEQLDQSLKPLSLKDRFEERFKHGRDLVVGGEGRV